MKLGRFLLPAKLLQSCNHFKTSAALMAKGKKKQAASKDTATAQSQPIQAVFLKTAGVVGVRIHAKPGAKQSSITAVSEDAVEVQIGAPPVDGEANAELIKYLAKALDLRKTAVSLDKGSRSRDKLALIETKLTCEELRGKLTSLIGL